MEDVIDMKNLFKAELYKLFKLPVYKFLLAVLFIIVILDNFLKLSNIKTASGYEWLCFMKSRMLWNIVVIIILTAVFVGGEFSKRTFMMGLLCGESRRNFILAKFAAIFTGSLPFLAIYAITGFTTETLMNGFGMPSDAHLLPVVFREIFYCILIHLNVISVAMLMTMLIKNEIFNIILITAGFYYTYVLIANLRFMSEGILSFLVSILRFSIIFQTVSPRSYPQYQPPIWIAIISSAAVVAGTSYMATHLFTNKDLK